MTTGAFLTQNNNIVSNFIGTNPGGTQPLGNCYGAINPLPTASDNDRVDYQSGRNIVSDNGFNAIACTEEYLYGVVEGGYLRHRRKQHRDRCVRHYRDAEQRSQTLVGSNRTRGTVEFYYSSAVSYFGAPGGTSDNAVVPAFAISIRQITRVLKRGIYFSGGGTIGFFNNYIGTTAQGDQPLGNISAIGNSSGSMYVGGVGTDSGGGTISLGNLIFGEPKGAKCLFFWGRR